MLKNFFIYGLKKIIFSISKLHKILVSRAKMLLTTEMSVVDKKISLHVESSRGPVSNFDEIRD